MTIATMCRRAVITTAAAVLCAAGTPAASAAPSAGDEHKDDVSFVQRMSDAVVLSSDSAGGSSLMGLFADLFDSGSTGPSSYYRDNSLLRVHAVPARVDAVKNDSPVRITNWTVVNSHTIRIATAGIGSCDSVRAIVKETDHEIIVSTVSGRVESAPQTCTSNIVYPVVDVTIPGGINGRHVAIAVDD